MTSASEPGPEALLGLARRGDKAALGRLLDCFSPQECANYIRHAGYPAT